MEVVSLTGFAVSLMGIFDKACDIWRVISTARNFGGDVEGSIRKLEIEFFRFQTWWKAVQKLEALPGRSYALSLCPEASSLASHLSSSIQNPIITAAHGILSSLVDIEQLLQISGILEVLKSQGNPMKVPGNDPPVKHTRIEDQLSNVTSTKSKMSRQLMSTIPWRNRVKYDATPWRVSDKQRLEGKLQDMVYWNDKLYDMLPHELRDSILRQGLSSFMLSDPKEAKSLSRLGYAALSEQAGFMEVYRQLMADNSITSPTPDEMRQRLIDIERFELVGGNYGESFSIMRSPTGQAYFIEWYQIQETTDAGVAVRLLIRERLAKLSVLLSKEKKPSTLCAAESIGYVDAIHFNCVGLISRVPDGASTALLPVSLFNLFGRKTLPSIASRIPLPTLSQRLTLASTLARSLYTFMLTRWYHKLLNSHNVYFLFPDAGNNLPDLDSPLIGGYSISRPSAKEEISILGTQSSLFETYLHPELRVSSQTKPKYVLKHEVYAFGLLLAEIGFWQPLLKIAGASSHHHRELSADGLRDAVIAKCSSDLACWTGEHYRDVTLFCLSVDSKLANQIDDKLTDFYWSVVWELGPGSVCRPN